MLNNSRLGAGLVFWICLLSNLADPTVALAQQPAFIDQDGDGIDDNLEQQLANKFAPVILIESDESNYPVNVEWFLARAHMQYHEDCGSILAIPPHNDVDDDIGPNPL